MPIQASMRIQIGGTKSAPMYFSFISSKLKIATNGAITNDIEVAKLMSCMNPSISPKKEYMSKKDPPAISIKMMR